MKLISLLSTRWHQLNKMSKCLSLGSNKGLNGSLNLQYAFIRHISIFTFILFMFSNSFILFIYSSLSVHFSVVLLTLLST